MGRVDAWIGVRERFWPAGASRATSKTVTLEGRVDAWIGVRERFWPAGTSRATSETARPVGTGGPGEKVDSGTDPVGDRGRSRALALRPVGIGRYPVLTGCHGGLATRALAVWDSASTAKMNEEVSKPFILWKGIANGSRN